VKKFSKEELVHLIYKIHDLLDEFQTVEIPANDLPDPAEWLQLEELAEIQNRLVHDFDQMTINHIQLTYENAFQIHENLVERLNYLKIHFQEYFGEKNVVVTPEPADAIVDTCNPVVIISKGAKKKISATKIITFCGYLFPKKFREEVKGDIYETRHEMFENGSSKIAVNFVTIFKIFSLILGSLRIRLSDLVKTENEMNK